MEWVTRPDNRGKPAPVDQFVNPEEVKLAAEAVGFTVPLPEENASFLAQQRALSPRARADGDPVVVRLDELSPFFRRIDKEHALLGAPKGVLSRINDFKRRYDLEEYVCYRREDVSMILAQSTMDLNSWFVVACWDWKTVLTYKKAMTVFEEQDEKFQHREKKRKVSVWLKYNVTPNTVGAGAIIVGLIIAVIIAIVAQTVIPLAVWLIFTSLVGFVEVVIEDWCS